MKLDNENELTYEQLKNSLINNYSFSYKSFETGYMLINSKLKLIAANQFCKKYFNITDKNRLDSLEIFYKQNAAALQLMNNRLYNKEQLLKTNNSVITKIHETVINDNIPIQFVYFIIFEKVFKSFLINFIPVSDKSGTVHFIQLTVSQYDFWGYTNAAQLFDKTISTQDYIMINEPSTLPVKLSPRQEEIVFVLSLGVGVRQAALMLQMSYGTIASSLRNSIYPKFDIHENDINLLVNKAKAMGYAQSVPQSLCWPKIIVLNSQMREKIYS